MAESNLTPVTVAVSADESPNISMQVIPFGLHVTQLLLNINGQSHDILFGPYEIKELTQQRFMINPVVGRYTNRLPVGVYEIEKDGARGTLKTISNESPTVSIHGGPMGFDRLTWTQIEVTESKNFSEKEKATIASLRKGSVAIFSLVSPDGDQGFPGELYTEVLFAVLPASGETGRSAGNVDLGALTIVYRARLISDTPVASPLNLTHHWGFNLSASLQPPQEPTVNKHWMRIDSSTRVELSPVHLATGSLIQTPKGSAWDWSGGKIIGDGAPPKYDGYCPFEKRQDAGQPIHLKLGEWEKGDLLSDIFDHSDKDVPVELFSSESGIRAKFQTNQPGVQFYGGEGAKPATKKAIHGGSATGPGYQGRPAAYLEFQEMHAAWMHPWGAQGDDTILTTNDMYNNYVKVIFSYEGQQ